MNALCDMTSLEKSQIQALRIEKDRKTGMQLVVRLKPEFLMRYLDTPFE